MAEIIKLSDRRKKEQPSLQYLIDNAVELTSIEWEKFARLNRLNEYFLQKAGIWADNSISYMSDLTAISEIEQKLGMSIIVRSPFQSNLGWRASFPTKSSMITTPDMPFETYARCFNIILFLKLKRDLVQHGYADEL